MSSCSVWIIVASCVLGGDTLVTDTDSKASMMMLVAGTTSSEEQCLIESIDQMSLGSCSAAIAAGDGMQKCDISFNACSKSSNLPLCRSGALVLPTGQSMDIVSRGGTILLSDASKCEACEARGWMVV